MFLSLWKWWGKPVNVNARPDSGTVASPAGDQDDAHRRIIQQTASDLAYADRCIRLLELERDVIWLRVERRRAASHDNGVTDGDGHVGT